MRGSGHGYGPPGGRSLGRWPQGKYWSSHDDLAANLTDRAAEHAAVALQHWASDDTREVIMAAIATGSAVELMTKAHLAQISPVLLAERADLDTLLHLLGVGERTKARPSAIRTISATTALKHARRLNPEIAYSTPGDDLVFDVRNAAVHVGIVSQEELHEAVGIMVRILDSLLVLSEWPDRGGFWGEDWLSAVDALADAAAGAVRRRLESKLASARARLATLLTGLDATASAVVRTNLAARSSRISIDHDERVTCPVCQEQAWLVCVVVDETREVDTDEGMYLDVVGQTAWPEEFTCNVCGLELDSREIGEVPSLPDRLELAAEEENWEPDEDLIRDR